MFMVEEPESSQVGGHLYARAPRAERVLIGLHTKITNFDVPLEPTWSRKEPWLATLRAERDNGQVSMRVRLLSAQLTDYERYACEFGYAYNSAAGEDIRVLRRDEHQVPESLIERGFWLINDDTVVWMFYDEHGRYLGAELADARDLDAHLRARDGVWDAAEPFPQWWARHPELHRRLAA
jgi:hypothetical protein